MTFYCALMGHISVHDGGSQSLRELDLKGEQNVMIAMATTITKQLMWLIERPMFVS